MQATLISLAETMLLGVSIDTTVAEDEQKTPFLLQTLMPQKKHIQHKKSSDVYLIKTNPYFFAASERHVTYTKKACFAVTAANDLATMPQLAHHTLQGGLYAVFNCHGPNDYRRLFASALPIWLDKTNHQIDNRDQFDLLPAGYDPNNPAALEYVYIPIKEK